MTKKSLVLGIMMIIIPFLIAVNFIRKTENPNDYVGLGDMLQIFEETDISFSKTYQAAADVGQSWGDVFNGWTPPTEGDFWDKVASFFTYVSDIFGAFWDLLEFPVMVVVDICTNASEVMTMFVDILYFPLKI